jgi:HK97 gp10 family phage protein
MARGRSRAKIVVTGDRKIDRKLRALGPKVANKVVRKALRAGGKVFQAELQRNAPEGETGELKREIKVRAAKRSRKVGLGITVAVVPLREHEDKFYAIFPELGTVDQPAQGYGRRSFDSQKDHVKRLVMDEIRRGAEREASS